MCESRVYRDAEHTSGLQAQARPPIVPFPRSPTLASWPHAACESPSARNTFLNSNTANNTLYDDQKRHCAEGSWPQPFGVVENGLTALFACGLMFRLVLSLRQKVT
jgi:hypothetical protein